MNQLVAVTVIVILTQIGSISTCIHGCQSCYVDGVVEKCTKCHSGNILESSFSCLSCPSTCSHCDGSSDCFSCINGRYGYRCSSSCHGCINNECVKSSGACSNGCQDGFYQYTSGLCYSCFENCLSCSHESNCTVCRDGFYGLQCRDSCPGCMDGKCDKDTGVCNLGCKDKHYIDSTGHCLPCNENCTSCTALDTCTGCVQGFYLTAESKCTSCSEHCRNGYVCNRTNGHCEEGCENTWSGERCFGRCAQGCTQCSQAYSHSCTVCQIGKYGASCEHNCSSGCISGGSDTEQICNKTTGFCEFWCIGGAWGETCENNCSSGCNGGLCNRSTGHCVGSCKLDFFGDMCNEQCSGNCFRPDNDSSTRYCLEENGHCINGCKSGWFSDRCTKGCSKNCKDEECFRNNGSCVYGCVDDYSGFRCDRHDQALRSDEPGPNVAAIGGGVGGAVAILIIIGIVICILLYRRRSALSNVKNREIADKKTKQSNQRQAFYNLNVIERRDGLNDIEMQPRAINSYYINEVEIDENDATQHDGLDVNRAVDNTYGNVGGKRVAVENLADYVKHKSLEEMLNEYGRLPEGLLKPFGEARRPQNALKNKYRAIYPYDENRVVLFGDDGNDYMNASYIDGYNRSREYIASSGPFQRSYDTTSDFWRMIVQEKCETIVMLTNLYEEGQPKCVKYWPDADESCQYGEINITCLTEDVYADFTIRVLAVTKGDDSNNIHHIHFTAWPDKGIPHDVTSMIEFRQKIRSLHKDKESPILVHCSAGIGRTGTFIALDMLTYEGEERGSVDIYDAVTNLRYERCNMVQTAGQYVYLHHAVLHSLTFDCRSVPGDMFLQNYNKVIEKNGGERIIDKQFQQLQTISDEITEEASEQIEKNRSLSKSNRSGADIPADEYRVKLHENRTSGDPDYINAVFVNSYRKRCKFICAQTPLPTTVIDFLGLIYQERCTCIVSMEEPQIHDKAVKVYWPADNQVVKHGVFEVRCKESTTTDHYMTKKLCITFHGPKGKESRDVNLYILTNRPKNSSVPKTPDSILELVKTVDAANRKIEDEPAILIHCRTGAERSCLYCAVSVLIEKMEIEHEVSVFNTLRQIKARRLVAFSSASYRKRCKFICAQTPLPTTVIDFLGLIYQERCTCIVSMEEPQIHDKAVKVYWPADNQVVKHGVFEVRCKESTTTDHYMTKKLCITFHGPKGKESRDVNLYILTNRPKNSSVPKTPDSILELVKTVDAANRKIEDEPAILIHCRTGAERSCLYCAVSVLIEKMEIEHEVSVFNTLRQIKARRLVAFSSAEQFEFCYQAVIRYLQSFDIYSNFSLRENCNDV